METKNRSSFLNEDEKKIIGDMGIYFLPMIFFLFIGIGNITYLLSFIVVGLFEKYYTKKLNTKYILNTKQISLITLILYFLEQYFILKSTHEMYGIIYFTLIAYYFLFYFKVGTLDKGMWINFLGISSFLSIIILVYFVPITLNVFIFLMMLSVISMIWGLISFLCNDIKESIELNLMSIVPLKMCYHVVSGLLRDYITESAPEYFIYFLKFLLIILTIMILIKLKDFYNYYKETKIVKGKEKIYCIFATIVFAYITIQSGFYIMVDCHIEIFNIL